MDDIVIYSKNEEDHTIHLITFLQTMNDIELYAKLSKCEFLLEFLESLGHIFFSDGNRGAFQKIKGVQIVVVPHIELILDVSWV